MKRSTIESLIKLPLDASHETSTLSKKEEGQFRNKLYDILIRTLEAVPNSTAEDKMLINTALYLKSGDNWKEVIREYWRGKGR